MKEIKVFKINWGQGKDLNNPTPKKECYLATEELAKMCSEQTGSMGTKGSYSNHTIFIAETPEEFTEVTSIKTPSQEEFNDRIKKRALSKLSEEEKRILRL